MNRIKSVLFLGVLALAGCGGGDDDEDMGGQADAAPMTDAGPEDPGSAAQTWCDSMTNLQCELIIECLTETERMEEGLPATVEECREAFAIDCTVEDPCASEEPPLTFQPDRADACVTEFAASTCEQFLDPEFAPGPACQAVCQ